MANKEDAALVHDGILDRMSSCHPGQQEWNWDHEISQAENFDYRNCSYREHKPLITQEAACLSSAFFTCPPGNNLVTCKMQGEQIPVSLTSDLPEGWAATTPGPAPPVGDGSETLLTTTGQSGKITGSRDGRKAWSSESPPFPFPRHYCPGGCSLR